MTVKPSEQPLGTVLEAGHEEDFKEHIFTAYGAQTKTSGLNTTRSSFIPASDSPGPAAYSPESASANKYAAPRATFGTSRRENESHRYISEMHNKTLPPYDTPGPGTYRTHKNDSPKRHGSPTTKFGTAAQRPDPSKFPAASVPGPIYDQSPPGSPLAYTFAPQGNIELGMTRSRDDWSKMYLSRGHAEADRSAAAASLTAVAPGAYDVSNYEALSPKRRAPKAAIGRSTRDVQDSLHTLQLGVEPLATTAAATPGAVYDLPGQLDTRAQKFGSGPRIYSPEKGPASAGPYISRLHEDAMKGTNSPGPGSYDVQGGRNKPVAGLGDAPNYTFGTLGERSPQRGMMVPGPGAYNPKEDALSRTASAPAFSVGAYLRTDFAALNSRESPGPAAYDTAHASTLEGRKAQAPAYSMGSVSPKKGRSSFVPESITPGPNAYGAAGPGMDLGPGRGYSFGLRERTRHEKSTVGVRYHGPLAIQEALGTQSPGPVYDVGASVLRLSNVKEMPHLKFSTAGRQTVKKVYISRQHAEAEGLGQDSPGPGAYEHHNVELADVTSRYRKPASAVFSTSERFKSNYMTK
mmetsp:Transcript_9744/g.20781  ORF Transcript_9744/g.20781 Transcript_9744/m.20781 type:complete len:577 (-) Transcript_9744:1287-3017(-)